MKIVKSILKPLITELALPKEAKPIRVMKTQTEAILWVLMPEEKIKSIDGPEACNEVIEIRRFQIFYESQSIPEGAEYIDSFSLDNGYTHRHLFEIK
jgi:hypothetical protein